MKNLFRNDAGFSLAELVVAVGVVGVISIGIIQLVEKQSKIQKKAEIDFEVNSLSTSIAQYLRSSDNCKATLTGVGTIINNRSIPAIIRVKRGGGTSKIFKVGEKYAKGSVTLKKITVTDLVTNPSPIPAGMTGFGELFLQVDFDLKSKIISFNKASISKKIPLKVSLDSGLQIVQCNSATEDAYSSSLIEGCTSIGGTFNSSTGKCILKTFVPPSPATDLKTAVSTKYLKDSTKNYYVNDYVQVMGDTMTGNLTLASSQITARNIKASSKVCVGSRCRKYLQSSCGVGKVVVAVREDGTVLCTSTTNCGTNKYFVGVEGGNIKCVPFTVEKCPSGQYVYSISPSGDIVCRPLPVNNSITCSTGYYIESISSTRVPVCRLMPIDTNTNVFGKSCTSGKAVTGYNSSGVPYCGGY